MYACKPDARAIPARACICCVRAFIRIGAWCVHALRRVVVLFMCVREPCID